MMFVYVSPIYTAYYVKCSLPNYFGLGKAIFTELCFFQAFILKIKTFNTIHAKEMRLTMHTRINTFVCNVKMA